MDFRAKDVQRRRAGCRVDAGLAAELAAELAAYSCPVAVARWVPWFRSKCRRSNAFCHIFIEHKDTAVPVALFLFFIPVEFSILFVDCCRSGSSICLACSVRRQAGAGSCCVSTQDQVFLIVASV